MSRLTYDELLIEINGLEADEQLRLLEELATTVRRRLASRDQHSVLELRGLGSEAWRGIDAQEYVDRERASWSG